MGKKLAIFDFDGTLFTKETLPFLLKQYGKMGYSRGKQIQMFTKVIFEYIKHKRDVDYGKEAFRGNVTSMFLQVFEGMKPEEVKYFFESNVDGIMEHLNRDVLNELQTAKLDGYETILLSGCFEEVLAKLSEVLGIDVYIGTEVHYTDSGIDYSHPLQIASGKNKVKFLFDYVHEQDIDWNASRAYGDSSYDSGILELVGQPVAVKPDDGLRRMAKDKNWRILD